jgi:hypothetical protein
MPRRGERVKDVFADRMFLSTTTRYVPPFLSYWADSMTMGDRADDFILRRHAGRKLSVNRRANEVAGRGRVQ